MRALSAALITIAVAIALAVIVSELRSAFRGFQVMRHWIPLSKPYSAYVVGLADRGGVRAKNTAPIVEVRFSDGSREKFTSSFPGVFHLIGVGSPVSVLASPSGDAYEIDSSFHLWIKAVLFGFGVLAALIGIPAFVFFRPLAVRSLSIRPIPRLRRRKNA